MYNVFCNSVRKDNNNTNFTDRNADNSIPFLSLLPTTIACSMPNNSTKHFSHFNTFLVSNLKLFGGGRPKKKLKEILILKSQIC